MTCFLELCTSLAIQVKRSCSANRGMDTLRGFEPHGEVQERP